jgi:hypothetical protein
MYTIPRHFIDINGLYGWYSFLYLDISDIEGGVEKVVRVVIKEWIDFFKSFSVTLDVVYTSGDVFILILLNVIKLVILF